MKLKVSLARETKHKDFVSAVGWLSAEEVFTAADDHKVLKWNLLTGETAEIATLPETLYPTDLQWFPTGAGGKKSGGSDIFVLTASDGKFYLISRTGRVEKVVEAHRGAALCARWSNDAASLLTAGEDGAVKVWSRGGMLRFTLCQNSAPIYAATWSPDNGSILYTQGHSLHVKGIQGTSKSQKQWKAHDGVILCVDWSANSGFCVSGAEDGKYKVWDAFGRNIFTSLEHDFPITSIRWSHDGELFAVGSFNTLRLCDRAGWSHSMEQPATGSILRIAWSPDSTQIACACANANVVFASLVDLRAEWRDLEVVQVKGKALEVTNVSNNTKEHLELKDRVVKLNLGYNHLIVCTSAQCYIYSAKNWTTPNIFDLKEAAATLIVMSQRGFFLVDGGSMGIYSFEGRSVCSVKLASVRPEALSKSTVSLSPDTLSIRDSADTSSILVLDGQTGKPIQDGKISHTQEVTQISVDQTASGQHRTVAFCDASNDLFLCTFSGGKRIVKLGSLISQVLYNDSTPMLCGLQENKILVWTYPNIAFIDKDLVAKTIIEKESTSLGKIPTLLSFFETQVSVRRADGSLVSSIIPAYFGCVHELLQRNKWDDALRICRHLDDDALWATVGSIAANNKNLQATEAAYSAINEAEKVLYIQGIKSMPQKEHRDAELLILNGAISQGESALLTSGQPAKAILMNVQLHRWDRALELAIKHKQHIETVLAFRQRYIEDAGLTETKEKFIQQAKETDVDWEQVQQQLKT